MYQTFQSGTDELDPLPLLRDREIEWCSKNDVPFLVMQDAKSARQVWAYLWTNNRVTRDIKDRLGDAPAYVMLRAQCPHMGTVASAVFTYSDGLKNFGCFAEKKVLAWNYSPVPFESVALSAAP